MAPNESHNRNGVNVDALLRARKALAASPEAAQFQWRACSHWVGGAHCQTTVQRFFGLGAEQARKAPHVIDVDHPEVLGSTDRGLTPSELVLAGLAGCLTGGIALVATRREIVLRSVSATVTADMDLAGMLGVDDDVRAGFRGIEITYEIDADAGADELRRLVAQSQRRSPVYDTVVNLTAITIDVVKLGAGREARAEASFRSHCEEAHR